MKIQPKFKKYKVVNKSGENYGYIYDDLTGLRKKAADDIVRRYRVLNVFNYRVEIDEN